MGGRFREGWDIHAAHDYEGDDYDDADNCDDDDIIHIWSSQ